MGMRNKKVMGVRGKKDIGEEKKDVGVSKEKIWMDDTAMAKVMHRD